jgi:UDP-glucose 4-epimerase
VQILVTGCAGYIGSIICQTLIKENHSVIGLDNLSTGFRENIPPAVNFHEGDIADATLLKKIKDSHPELNLVIHLAGFIEVAESVKNPKKYFDNNFHKANLFLDSLEKLNFKNIIFSSTAAVYGIPSQSNLINLTETSSIDENATLAPINPYGSSKLEFEKVIQASSLNYIIFRFFNVAGADGVLGECHQPETHLIPLLLDFALGKREDFSIYGNDYPTADATAVRDYIHIKDLAQAHLLALKALCSSDSASGSQNINQIYNLGYGQGFSVKEIVNITEKLINQKINYGLKPRRIGDPAYLVANPEKALRLLGFQPKFHSIETIIKDALDHRKTWYKTRSHS